MRAPSPPRLSRLAVGLVALTVGACHADDPPQTSARTGLLAANTGSDAVKRPPEAAPPSNSKKGETWNAAQIDWQPYEAGLAKARADRKPVLLVLYADWCPHCRTYSRVFDDARVVESARSFVMIRANVDDDEGLAARYAKDGSYVPRTFVLAPDGAVQEDIHAARPTYRHFFDEKDPASILTAMATALERFGKRGG